MSAVIQENKGWFVFAGILLIIIGIAAVALPFAAAIAVEIMVGWILVVSGIVQIIHSFKALSTGRCVLRLLGGILYLAVGVIFLIYPLEGLITLTLLLAVLFMFEALIKVIVAFRIRTMANWGWLLASGIAAFIISVIIFSGWPGTATWVIGLLVGINLIFGGSTMLMLTTE